MNIGILTRYLAGAGQQDSGIGQHYRALAEALAALGHRVHVVHAVPRPLPESESTLPGLSVMQLVTPLPLPLKLLTRRSWPLQNLLEDVWTSRKASGVFASDCRRRSIAVVETHSFQAPARYLLRSRSRPTVFTRVSTTARQVHRFSSIHSRTLHWHAKLEHDAIHRSDRLLTHTYHHRDLICGDEKIAPDRFAIVPHGLPDPGEPPAFAATNPDSEIEFLYVGRFEPRKGFDVLLAAIPDVAAKCPNTSFTLVGAGGAAAWTQFALGNAELARGRARYLGSVSPSQLDALYRRCSIVVAPSRYESFGLIYVEAMGRAKPVIGCVAGGIPEVVENGVTGLLAQPGDVPTLKTCMLKLAQDTTLREQLSVAARKEFLSRFSAEVMAQRSAEVYASAVGTTL